MSTMDGANSASSSIRRLLPVNCHCSEPLVTQTSKTKKNPGRRFLGCRNYKERWGCDFFKWVDNAIPPHTLEMIERIEQENAVYKKRNTMLKIAVGLLISIIVVMW